MSLPKPYYDKDGITIYNADMRIILPELESESADILWTDPPYGHNNNNNNGDLIHRLEMAIPSRAKKGQEGILDEARPIANDGQEDMKSVVDFALIEASRILKRDCCCCCCGGGGPSPAFAWLASRMDTKGLSFFHAVVWDKGGLGIGWRYRRNYEMVMVAHRKGGKLKWEWDGAGMETANVVRLNKIIPTALDHPTPKPVSLVSHFLRLHAKPGDLIIDPFAGAGPVAVAAKEAGCRYIGIELDERWCAMAVKRLRNYQGVLPLSA